MKFAFFTLISAAATQLAIDQLIFCSAKPLPTTTKRGRRDRIRGARRLVKLGGASPAKDSTLSYLYIDDKLLGVAGHLRSKTDKSNFSSKAHKHHNGGNNGGDEEPPDIKAMIYINAEHITQSAKDGLKIEHMDTKPPGTYTTIGENGIELKDQDNDSIQGDGVHIWVGHGKGNSNNHVEIELIKNDGDGVYIHMAEGEDNQNNTLKVKVLQNEYQEQEVDGKEVARSEYDS